MLQIESLELLLHPLQFLLKLPDVVVLLFADFIEPEHLPRGLLVALQQVVLLLLQLIVLLLEDVLERARLLAGEVEVVALVLEALRLGVVCVNSQVELRDGALRIVVLEAHVVELLLRL